MSIYNLNQKKGLKMGKILKFSLISAVLSLPLLAKSIDVDALIIYSKGVKAKYNGDEKAKIEQLIATTNKIYKDSNLNIKLNAVKIMEYDALDDSKKTIDVLSQIQKDKTIKRIRDEVGADEVIIYRPYAHDGVCGLAYLNKVLASKDSAKYAKEATYAHITIDCGGYVTAHEVGHNMGLGHSYKQGSTGAFTYARGHGVQNQFTTIMAYKSAYNGKKIYKFSSPKLECDGLPCGVEVGKEDEADAVKALAQTVPLLANLREHKVDRVNSKENNKNTTNRSDFEKVKKAFLDAKKRFIEARNQLLKYKSQFKKAKKAFYKDYKEYKKVIKEYKEGKTTYSNLKNTYYKVYASYINYKKAYFAFKNYYTNNYIIRRNELLKLWQKYNQAKKSR